MEPQDPRLNGRSATQNMAMIVMPARVLLAVMRKRWSVIKNRLACAWRKSLHKGVAHEHAASTKRALDIVGRDMVADEIVDGDLGTSPGNAGLSRALPDPG